MVATADGSIVGVRMQVAATDQRKTRPENTELAWRSILVGSSPALMKVIETIGIIAGRRTTVLISGETGSGKEIVAKAIHLGSPRASRAFVAVNCAAIPKEFIEIELFGHVRGAFTGAPGSRLGRLEQAEGGTLFLDEIGDMPLKVQAKLLRFLQESEFQRLGSSENINLDVRVLAATNADLLQRMKQGKFREDLYYRLHVFPLRVPPLRDRRADIPALAQHFVSKVAAAEGLSSKSITPEALDKLARYSWPGNVRQLENTIERAMIVSAERPALEPSDFGLPDTPGPIEVTNKQLLQLPEQGLDFEAVISRIEFNLLKQALLRSNGNKSLAADMLRLKRTTLAAKLKALGCTLADDQPAGSEEM